MIEYVVHWQDRDQDNYPDYHTSKFEDLDEALDYIKATIQTPYETFDLLEKIKTIESKFTQEEAVLIHKKIKGHHINKVEKLPHEIIQSKKVK